MNLEEKAVAFLKKVAEDEALAAFKPEYQMIALQLLKEKDEELDRIAEWHFAKSPIMGRA